MDDLAHQAARIEDDLNKLIDALISAPPIAHQRIYDRMQALEQQKASVEQELSALRLAAAVRLDRAEVEAWLRHFCSGDPTDPAYRADLLSAFVNAVYVHDDRIIILYNLRTTPPTPPQKQKNAPDGE